MGKDYLKEIENIASELLVLMGTKASAVAEEDKENDAIVVNISSKEEAGLLIGHRGETLNSLELILGIIFRQKAGEWKRIIVNVGDWREKQNSYLRDLARTAADRVKQTGEPQILYNLSAGERRIIHLALSGDPGVETGSQGEGEERFLVIKPKK